MFTHSSFTNALPEIKRRAAEAEYSFRMSQAVEVGSLLDQGYKLLSEFGGEGIEPSLIADLVEWEKVKEKVLARVQELEEAYGFLQN